jgi:hypothetical protein
MRPDNIAFFFLPPLLVFEPDYSMRLRVLEFAV